MFHKFITSGLDVVKQRASDSKYVVRYTNIPIYEAILKYCKANKLMVSQVPNMVAQTTNCDVGNVTSVESESRKAYSSEILKEYGMDEIPFTTFFIYGAFIFRHATAIANELAEHHTKYVELFTSL